MSQHARVEEVSDSDSDPADMDPSDFDPSDTLFAPVAVPSSSRSAGQLRNQGHQHPHGANPTRSPDGVGGGSGGADPELSRRWQCLYPVYFDAGRSRAEGRRVGKELAVQNPLAREIVDAVQALDLDVVFEPGKTHPKDWSNPGRVRLLLKQDGKNVAKDIKNSQWCRIVSIFNFPFVCIFFTFIFGCDSGVHALLNFLPWWSSVEVSYSSHHHRELRAFCLYLFIPAEHHLYILVAAYLNAHPATEKTPFRLRIAGVPAPAKYEPPAVPRGWKVNAILPLHSPAISGGGVSENFLKDMMAEMQGEAPSGNEGKKKKDKKKGKS